ncbi:MAG: hypothetical protein ACO3JL_00925 [Myxococcota bacterium]
MTSLRLRLSAPVWLLLASLGCSPAVSGDEDGGAPSATQDDAADVLDGDASAPPAPEDAGAPPAEAESGATPDGGTDLGADPVDDDEGAAPPGEDAPDPAEPSPPPATPPPLPSYSGGVCPSLVVGPTKATSLNEGFPSSGEARDFRVLVPDNYDDSEAWPVLFFFHWLNASGKSMIDDGELETAIEQQRFIAVVPERLKKSNGSKAYQFDWPFVETWGAEKELVFFDDMLACVSEQFTVDPARVHVMGVSAGGLWVTYLMSSDRAERVASLETLSGGLGRDGLGVWEIEFQPSPHKYPALVLWGGSTDWLGINFEQASKRLRDALLENGHFVVTCTHDEGHAIPPVENTAGRTRFESLWSFLLDHPYGTTTSTTPYQGGLPAVYPSWCGLAQP